MGLSTLRQESQFAFWAVACLVAALAWFVVSEFGLRAYPPLVGGVTALIAVAGAVIGLVGLLPGNKYRGISLAAVLVNAATAICFAPWVLWGL